MCQRPVPAKVERNGRWLTLLAPARGPEDFDIAGSRVIFSWMLQSHYKASKVQTLQVYVSVQDHYGTLET